MSFYLGGLAFTLPPISMTFATSAVYADDGKGRNVDQGPACTAAGGKERRGVGKC